MPIDLLIIGAGTVEARSRSLEVPNGSRRSRVRLVRPLAKGVAELRCDRLDAA